MSFSFLLGNADAVDQDLFTATIPSAATAEPMKKSKKGKQRAAEGDATTVEAGVKKSKKRKAGSADYFEGDVTEKSEKAADKSGKMKQKHTSSTVNAEKQIEDASTGKQDKKRKKDVSTAKASSSTPTKAEKRKKTKAARPEVVLESDDDDDDVENAYNSKASKEISPPDTTTESAPPDSDEDEDDNAPYVPPAHEASNPSASTSATPKLKKTAHVPSSETPAQRDTRTLFIGNAPIAVAQKRPLLKALHRHILSHLPAGVKIESSRVRSVAFQAPTAKLPEEGDDKKEKEKEKKTGREHDKERTQAWRDQRDQYPEGDNTKDAKQFLTSGQKKRIAFIHGEFHAEADRANVYMVLGFPNPDARGAAKPTATTTEDAMDEDEETGAPTMLTPYEAAVLAKEKCDGTTFMDRVIRVDVVGQPVSSSGAGKDAGHTDPKLSVFVGNLDFAVKDEDLRAFMESILRAELGVRDVKEVEEEGAKHGGWVDRVRIVRDRETLVGKGFAYVQFVARECVDELFSMDAEKLNLGKRTLRIQRCKSLPNAQQKRASQATIAGGGTESTRGESARRPFSIPIPTSIPRGDPALGEKLAGLSKEDRKEAKKADAERVQRRLAKKKVKNAMVLDKGREDAKDRPRIRVRKEPASSSKGGPKGRTGFAKGKKVVRKGRS